MGLSAKCTDLVKVLYCDFVFRGAYLTKLVWSWGWFGPLTYHTKTTKIATRARRPQNLVVDEGVVEKVK